VSVSDVNPPTTVSSAMQFSAGEEISRIPGVMIYSPQLLPAVQHYVREHALRLRRYRSVLAGRRRVDAIPFEDFSHFLFPRNLTGRVRELRYLLAGIDARLIAFVRHHRIRLIHAHFGPGGTEVMPIAVRLGIPLVVTFHGWDVKLGAETGVPMSLYERLYRRRLPQLFQRASRIICVSQNWRDRVVALGCPPEKVLTNYLGVDSAFFDGCRGEIDPLSIMFVGRLVKRKGVHTLMKALSLLRKKNLPVHLTIAGEGPEEQPLKRLAEELKLPVRFLGAQTSAQIRDLLRGAAVLCAPSTTAGGEVPEALGLVILEAQAMSVPVVATRNGGIPEAMQDGETGLLVDEDSVSDLAAALGRILGDDELSRRLGERARAFVCDRFDIERCYNRLEDIYDSIVFRAGEERAVSQERLERRRDDSSLYSEQATINAAG
jgi:colanic acid/amylovoran biosynthesis glycosyltransferase